jgi:hypothetical protein
MQDKKAKELLQAAALISSIKQVDAKDRADLRFTVAEVAAMLRVDPKQLHRARVDQEELLALGGNSKNQKKIDPLLLESIPCIPSSGGRYAYSAEAIHDYLNRVRKAEQDLAYKIQAMTGLNAVLGFQSWLCTMMPTDTWPFSIQQDGRPIDLCAAIVLGQLTGDAELLTIREFSDRAAHASAKAFHDAESEILKVETSMPNPQKIISKSKPKQP